MIRSYALLLALLAFSMVARAQSSQFGFEYRPVAKVVHGADTLRNAWAGGLNTPQFSTIDLNNDGQQDLFAFDHETSRIYTFLSVVAPGTTAGRRWQYAPQYESIFPDSLTSWVLLRDYDCDGRADIFTYVNGGDIAVLRNVLVNGQTTFQLTTNQIRFTGNFPGSANLTIGGYNLPAIQDVNGDGKLDIMSYDFISAQYIEQYINISPGTCGSALNFTISTGYWGGIQSCSSCSGYSLNSQTTCFVAKTLHTGGHSLLLVDLDGDGDMDLLDGRDNCSELTRLLNQGTTTSAVLSQAGISSNFPSAASRVNVPVFPAAYSFDANFDGRPDLVVAPNMVNNLADRVSFSQQVKLYTNSAASGAPVYTYQPAGFLQNEMIDVSEGAAPTFGDLDGDGLTDMLIGNHADLVGTAYRATLTYYRNVGTLARPVFKLTNNDYLGLATQGLQGIKPVLVDLNRDGALDLAYSCWDRGANFFYFILNTAQAGQPAVFNAANAVTLKPQGPPTSNPSPTYPPTAGILPYYAGDMPFFTDVDNDGFVDLLIGTNEPREPGMSLRYFRNRGRGPLDSAFVLVDNDFGHFRTPNGRRPVNLSPTVADFDGDGWPDLVVADNTGFVSFVSNYRNQGVIFSHRNDVLYNSVTGRYEYTRLGKDTYAHYGLAAADLNGDGVPELLIGTQAGGVLSYGTRNRSATATRSEVARTLAMSIYPNPATAVANIETATPTRLTVFDLTGRLVQTAGMLERNHALSLTGLAPGVYLVRAEGSDGTAAVQRLAVQ